MEDLVDELYVIRRIKRNPDVNCVAIVVSSWHYINALANIGFLIQKGKVKKAIILICKHGQAGLIVDQTLYENSVNSNIENMLFHFRIQPHWRDVKKYLMDKEKYKRDFFILRPVEPKIEFTVSLWMKGVKRNYCQVIIDEGLGYYLRSTLGWYKETKIITSGQRGKKANILASYGKKFYINLMLRRKRQLRVNTFFITDKRRKQLKVNNICIKYLRDTFINVSRNYYHFNRSLYENKLIICTQPFNDLGMLRNNSDVKVIRELCAMAKQHGIGVVIKPHPRETIIEKYQDIGADIDVNNLIPLEIILAGLRKFPIGIVGISTTTLVSAKILWNIPTFSIINIVGKDNFDKSAIEDIRNFSKLFSEYVKILNRLEDMFESIGKE